MLVAYIQPAVYIVSLALVEGLKVQEKGQYVIDSVDVTCGLSLGEYTALTFVGAFSFEDGLKLVKIQGEAMQLLILSRTSEARQRYKWNLEQTLGSGPMIIVQAATEAAPSSMVSVIGLNSDKITAIRNAANDKVSEDEKVQIANFLFLVSWPIYVFCCFSFTSGVVLGIINIYVKTYAYVPSKSTAL
ncbi:unnamed protein product [Sphagnum jensenii]|uniref:Malonyl-CoA:ACP transacylase (MAT) domain-containing protein n=1 Tax=Sphagnum jensenii TaxID=128206 RepID=A0ABP1A5I6_9BRYO